MTDPAGTTTEVEVSDWGDPLREVKQVRDPDGTVTRTAYDDLGRVLWQTDRYAAGAGGATDNTTTSLATKSVYDSLGRAVRTERWQGVLVTVTDDAAPGLPAGMKKSAASAAAATKLNESSTAYGPDARVQAQTDAAGQATQYAYRPDGSVAATTDATGTAQPGGETYRVAEVALTAGPTGTSLHPQDEFGVSIANPYPRPGDPLDTGGMLWAAAGSTDPAVAAQNLAAAINAAAADPLPYQTFWRQFAAVAEGSVVRITAKEPNWFVFAQVGKREAPTGPQNPTPDDRQTIALRWVREEHAVDALGNRTKSRYDALGRVYRTDYTDGSFTEARHSVNGAWVPGHDLSGLGVGIPLGGRQAVSVAQRKAGDPAVATSHVYDARGLLVAVVMPDPDGAGGPLGPAVWRYEYDVDGNQTKVVDPRSGVTSATWNPTGRAIETTFRYDEQGRRTRRTLPDGQAETWAYDARGRAHVHADFKGQSTRYEYYPDAHQHAGLLRAEHRYDAGVDPITSTAAERTEHDYDALGRQSVVREYAGATLARTTTTTYDPVTGHVASVASPEGTINYAYDPATGRHTRTWTTQNDTTYAYDELGRLKTVTATKLDGQTVNLVTTYTYDTRGSLRSVALPNGITTTYTYDALGRLDLTEVKRGTTFVATYDYELEADGQRDKVVERVYAPDGSTFGQTTIDWTYDGWDRLVAEDHDSHDSAQDFLDEYVYDPVGNRLTKRQDRGRNGSWDATTTYRYGTVDASGNLTAADGNDRLLWHRTVDGATTSTTTCAYDPNGSTTGKTADGSTVLYRYDLRNRMVALDQSGDGDITDAGDATFGYDHTGIRVGKHVVGTDAVRFLVDARNHTGYQQVLEEINGTTGAVTLSYLIGQDLIAQATGTTPRDFICDGKGSTRMLADAAGAVVPGTAFGYDAFGVAVGFATATAATRYLYNGEQTDSDLGMQYLRARYYSDRLGRFNSFDPHEGSSDDPQSLHKHVFVHNNGPNATDPTGMFINLTDSMSAMGNIMNQLGQKLPAVMQARRYAHGVINAVRTFNYIARVADRVHDTLSAVTDLIDLLEIDPSELVNFRALLSNLNAGGMVKFNLPNGIERRLNNLLGVMGNIPVVQEWIGYVVAGLATKAMAWETTSFTAGYHGIDALMRDTWFDRFAVVEAKGGPNAFLDKSNGQMYDRWIEKNVKRMLDDNRGIATSTDLSALDTAISHRHKMSALVVKVNLRGNPNFAARLQTYDPAKIGNSIDKWGKPFER